MATRERKKLTLEQVETQMEVLTKEEMDILKGGYTYGSGNYYFVGSGNSYGPYTAEESWRYNTPNDLWGMGFPAPYSPPEGVTVYGNPLANIRFSNSANQNAVSSYSLQVLNSILEDENITITSTARDPYNQARVMYDNIVRTSPENQKGIYAPPGDSVIDVYNKNLSREENIRNMGSKISEIGPTAVSKHCADLSVLNVMDISKSSIKNVEEFKRRLTNAGIKYLDENGCIHIEIKQ